MANNTASIHRNGTEYRFAFDGSSGIPGGLIIGMFVFTTVLSLIIAVGGFALGNVTQGFVGLAIFALTLVGPALATTKTVVVPKTVNK